MSDPISLYNMPFQPMIMADKVEGVKKILESEKDAHGNKNSSQLRKACSELESLFIFHLLKEMRATIPKTGLMGGGRAEEVYTSMLDLSLAKELASGRGIGISSLLIDKLGGDSGQVEDKNDENGQKD